MIRLQRGILRGMRGTLYDFFLKENRKGPRGELSQRQTVRDIYRYRVLILITRDSSRGGRSVVIGVWSRQSHSTARFSGPTVHVRGRAATLSMPRTRVVVRSVLIPLLLLSVVGVGRRVDAKRTKRKSVAAAVLTAPPLPPTWLAELTVVGWTEATTAHQGGDLSTAATRYQSLLYFPGR